MEKELIDFLKYVKEVHVDGYGHLEICDSGDELDPTVEKVVKDYLKSKEIQSGGGMVDAIKRSTSLVKKVYTREHHINERVCSTGQIFDRTYRFDSCPDY